MIKQYDLVLCIGRFQGLHRAHLEMLRRAGMISKKVAVVAGSAFTPRSPKNPWTIAERIAMLAPELTKLQAQTGALYSVDPNIDTLYDNDAWVARVQAIGAKHSNAGDRIALVGHKKDADTKEYLEMFPQWEFVGIDLVEQLDATQIRDIYFSDRYNPNFLSGVLPTSVLAFLDKFHGSDEYNYIMNEKKVIADIRKGYAGLRYPNMAVTVDAVVAQSGHILLIKRKSAPGKGLWALPGGYFNAGGYDWQGNYMKPDKDEASAILRELGEEVKGLDVPEKVLRGSIKEIRTFMHKDRSQIGRSLTFAAHISLPGGEWKLPKVRGDDDAEKAQWFPFIDLKREWMFDDHADIINAFIPLISL